MKKSFKTALSAILAACLIAAVFAGCAQTGQERAQDLNGTNDGMYNGMQNQGYNRNNLVAGRYGNMNGNNGINGGNTTGDRSGLTIGNRTGNTAGNTNGNTIGFTGNRTMNTNGNDRQRASTIERQLESINGINDCTVLVNGDTALVGLRNTGSNTGNLSRLRSIIVSRVKQIDNSIRNVRVTDSPDLLTRMGRLGTAGNNNGMADNFMEEFNKLIDSINGTAR